MKIKSLILTITLSLFALSGLLAQEKYEFALVKIQGIKVIVVSSANDKAQTFEIGKEDFEVALVKKVETLNQQGWELFNTSFDSNQGHTVYYLRKKKN